jgi:hypothetical protein
LLIATLFVCFALGGHSLYKCSLPRVIFRRLYAVNTIRRTHFISKYNRLGLDTSHFKSCTTCSAWLKTVILLRCLRREGMMISTSSPTTLTDHGHMLEITSIFHIPMHPLRIITPATLAAHRLLEIQ